MTMRILIATCLVLLAESQPGAELRYTARTEARRIESTTPPNPIAGLLGGMLLSRVPSGTATTVIGADSVRIEFPTAMGIFPAGSVMLLRQGSVSVLNPQEMTYWTLSDVDANAGLQLTPKTTSSRTGEFATVAGLRAERSTFTMSIDLPIPANMTLPFEFPRTMTMDGEMWVSDQYKEYGAVLAAAGNTIAAGFGLGVLPQDGFVTRQITRNALLGYEVEVNVLEISELPPSPELFQIPSGYREVPAPRAPALPR